MLKERFGTLIMVISGTLAQKCSAGFPADHARVETAKG